MCVRRLLDLCAVGLILVAGGCWDGRANAPQSERDASAAASSSAAKFPALTGRVVDGANVLALEQELALGRKSEALEAATGRQFVIVTVPTLDGQDIAVYTRDLGRHWGIGRKGHNDGVILLVAPTERKVRIAVGYGLEKTLPEALCRQIIDDHMLPRFRAGDLAGGIQAGADALTTRLS
jgi:uncharacterized protein